MMSTDTRLTPNDRTQRTSLRAAADAEAVRPQRLGDADHLNASPERAAI